MSQKIPYVGRTAPGGQIIQPRLSRPYRIGVVPYLNARPLVYGLEDQDRVALVRAVPSQLARMLAREEVDVALVPSIDLQRSRRALTVLPAGCISSAGTTLTVRVFSQTPPTDIRVLWTDTDSHTSIALARTLWLGLFRRDLKIIPYHPATPLPEDAEAVLLIGDKVVCDPPLGYDYQIDLGTLWFQMTGLPFVFAVWTARAGTDTADLFPLLTRARQAGQAHAVEVARTCGPGYGWPVDLAVKYLTHHLQFDFTAAHRDGMEEFFDRARDCHVLHDVHPVAYR